MIQITVAWEASEKLRKQEFIETGERPDANRKFQLDLAGLTPGQRKPIVEHLGLYCFTLSMKHTHDFNEKMPAPSYLQAFGQDYDHQPTMSDILSYVMSEAAAHVRARGYKAGIEAEKKATRERLQAIYDKLRLLVDVMVEQGDLVALEAFSLPVKAIANFKPSGHRSSLYELLCDGIKDLHKVKREGDKVDWIAAHGSAYLERVHTMGYNAQRLYVTERAAMEAPGFVVDFDERAEWRDRTCPSLAALDAEVEAEKLGIGEEVKVVWLVNPAANRVQGKKEDYYVFDAAEAVVIRNYLGRYDLVKVI